MVLVPEIMGLIRKYFQLKRDKKTLSARNPTIRKMRLILPNHNEKRLKNAISVQNQQRETSGRIRETKRSPHLSLKVPRHLSRREKRVIPPFFLHFQC
jgi:hypothetical protein